MAALQPLHQWSWWKSWWQGLLQLSMEFFPLQSGNAHLVRICGRSVVFCVFSLAVLLDLKRYTSMCNSFKSHRSAGEHILNNIWWTCEWWIRWGHGWIQHALIGCRVPWCQNSTKINNAPMVSSGAWGLHGSASCVPKLAMSTSSNGRSPFEGTCSMGLFDGTAWGGTGWVRTMSRTQACAGFRIFCVITLICVFILYLYMLGWKGSEQWAGCFFFLISVQHK